MALIIYSAQNPDYYFTQTDPFSGANCPSEAEYWSGMTLTMLQVFSHTFPVSSI